MGKSSKTLWLCPRRITNAALEGLKCKNSPFSLFLRAPILWLQQLFGKVKIWWRLIQFAFINGHQGQYLWPRTRPKLVVEENDLCFSQNYRVGGPSKFSRKIKALFFKHEP
jgi:hypothetical protein